MQVTRQLAAVFNGNTVSEDDAWGKVGRRTWGTRRVVADATGYGDNIFPMYCTHLKELFKCK